MNKLVSVLLIAVFAVLTVGCRVSVGQEPKPTPAKDVGSDKYFTVGDMAYIYINEYGSPEEHIVTIFNAIKTWQEENPDREIVGIDYIWRPEDHAYNDYTYGISILSRQKNQ